VDGLMTFCHDARKGRYIGSHWPNHVRASAPLDQFNSILPMFRTTDLRGFVRRFGCIFTPAKVEKGAQRHLTAQTQQKDLPRKMGM